MHQARPETSHESERDGLRAALAAEVAGEVRFDRGTTATYSTDASNYRAEPIGVVIPRSVDDAVAAMRVCREHGVPVLSRGGGTSLAGQCCNTAVVFDWSKYCDHLVSVNPQERTAIVEPGAAVDPLNRQLAPHGLMVGQRPSTHASCTIGGMVGNNSCGSTAQAYGKMVDSVRRLEILTYDGLRTWVGPTADERYRQVVAEGGRKAELYQGLRALRDEYLADIRTSYPDIPRRVSGYNLDALLPEHGFDVAKALVGSESTCVTVLHVEFTLVDVPAARSLVVLGYPDVHAAADAVPAVLEHRPSALEGLDHRLVELEQTEQIAGRALAELPHGSGWLMVQFNGSDTGDGDARARGLVDDLGKGANPPDTAFLDDPAHEDRLWKAREAGLGATAFPPQGAETHEGWEDAAVPPERLGDYLRDFSALLRRFGYERASLYGHFGQGCVHTRIPFDLTTAAGIARYREFAQAAAELVASYGGSLSGEHGDGQARGELLPVMFGDRIVAAFGAMKALFDPDNRMNPGKLVHPRALDQDLRLGTGYLPIEPATHFAYPHDGHRFSHAAARCVGVGNCRSQEGGVMCPSYRATREEQHSTRGRARLLFEMLNGRLRGEGWRSTAVRDALDLCLACKGCKSDCPVNVDMATYKAEFLSHHYARRIRPAAHYSMGWLPLWARLAALAPRTVNALAHAPGLAELAKRAGGVAPQRELPRVTHTRLTEWFAGREHRPGPRGDVLLWPDTFTNNFTPEVGIAAVRVLEAAGFGVRLPRRTACCGLTWISTGQLRTARRVAGRTLDTLRGELRAGTPIVALEPSCAAVFRSDLPELMYGNQDVSRLAGQTYTLAELLTTHAPDWQPPDTRARAVVQRHCHQHAVLGFDADRSLLRSAGTDAEVLDAGCCGLAGNFGFEDGHYEVSMACAEDALLPAVRATPPDTQVLADGFSCRTQIVAGEPGRNPIHLAELLAGALPEPAAGER